MNLALFLNKIHVDLTTSAMPSCSALNLDSKEPTLLDISNIYVIEKVGSTILRIKLVSKNTYCDVASSIMSLQLMKNLQTRKLEKLLNLTF